MTEAAGSDKSAKDNKGFGPSCDGNQLQRKTGGSLPVSLLTKNTLLKARGGAVFLQGRREARAQSALLAAPRSLLSRSFPICLRGSETHS